MGEREPSDRRRLIREPTGSGTASCRDAALTGFAAAGQDESSVGREAPSPGPALWEVVTVLSTSDFSSVLLDRVALKKNCFKTLKNEI